MFDYGQMPLQFWKEAEDTYGWGFGGLGGVAGGSADLGMLIVRYQYNIHVATDGQRQM